LLNEVTEEIIVSSGRNDVTVNIINPVNVTGDHTMIMQLFNNLIGNAVKYSFKTPQPLVSITCEQMGDFVQYVVADNGIGLDMKYASRIFELFQRLDNVKEISGTGVGLAIVKRIVEKHGGKIWVESVLNGGTSFFITLPKK